MKMGFRLGALALIFGLLSATAVAAAAFLPLEKIGREQVATYVADRSHHLGRAS